MKPKLQLTPKNKVKVRASVRLAYVGATFALAVAVAFLVYYNFGTSEKSIANEETVLPGFSKRAPLLISNDIIRGKEILTSFPVLIKVQSEELKHISKGGYVTHPKGYDIRVTKADGKSILSSQIEEYIPQKGELSMWVMIDTLSDKIGRDLFIYYSNSTIKSELPPVIWSFGYEAVMHLNGNTNPNNTRKIKSTQSGTSDALGKISSGKLFSSDRKDFVTYNYARETDLSGDFTLSAWIYLNELNKKQVIISNQGDQPGGYCMFIDQNNTLNASFYNASGKLIQFSETQRGETLEKNRWYHISVVFSTGEKTMTSYVDGITDKTNQVIDIPHPSAAELQLGRIQFDNESYFSGIIDEVRISSVARSQLWLATVFYNESLADKLFSLGNSEELSLSAQLTKENKTAILESDKNELDKNASNNTLRSNKGGGNSQIPGVISNNAEVIQARLNNIKRVAEENN